MKVSLGKYYKNAQRKINVEIDNYDTWNADHTLALIILPLLLQYKESHHGIPNDFADNSGNDEINRQQSFDFYQETHKEAFDKGCERWEEVLDKMIWSFYQIVADEGDSKYHHGKAKWSSVKSDDGYSQLVDTNPEDHWYDMNGHIKYEERVQEGLELFGKYYKNLWD